jgi:hypothetical protein
MILPLPDAAAVNPDAHQPGTPLTGTDPQSCPPTVSDYAEPE